MDNLLRQPPEKPMSVPEIIKRAEEFEYNPLVPLRYWLRTADTLLKEARIYELEGNDQQAFLLLFRHARLVLDYLAKHPDARHEENRLALEATEKALPKILAHMEVLKPRITQRYQLYWHLQEGKKKRTPVKTHEARDFEIEQVRRRESLPPRTVLDPALAGAAKPIAAGDNRDLAVRLAQNEFRRRETARKATRQAGISWAEEQTRRTAGVWGDWEEALAKDVGHDPAFGDDDIQPRVLETRRLVDGLQSTARSQRRNGADGRIQLQSSSDFSYPIVPKREERRYEDWIPDPLPPSSSLKSPERGILKSSGLPQVPPKDRILPNGVESPLARFPHQSFPHQPALSTSSTPNIPLDRPVTSALTSVAGIEPKPSNFTFKPSAYLENGTPLRTIFLPPNLRSTFLKIASPNTRANLETCGILCGSLISNALFISRLVIPEQENSSDTCEMINEGALVEFCEAEDLMTLGWIHTHPSQTCFMSSRDLHTHLGFQISMPESIAIVCAPSKSPSWGIFRLTHPPGLNAILNCRQPGIFHPHAEHNIYTDALRPGHVFEAEGLEFKVVDLRPRL